ncbi:MAG: hypothetical protein QM681_19630 [Novosphingobium sp.]
MTALLNQRSRDLGYAKGLLQSLIIAAEMPADVREQSMMRVAKMAEDALKGRLAA